MRLAAAVCLLALVTPAHAQMYKCVDERGRTLYSDKPIPNCKTQKTVEAPAPAPQAARPAPAPSGKAKAGKATPPPVAKNDYTPEQLVSRCKTLREERDWLNGPRGKLVEHHTERVAQVEQALRACR